MARSSSAVEITKDQVLGFDVDLEAEVLELHQPCELMQNQKMLNSAKGSLRRLADGSGDWICHSRKSDRYYMVGAGNVKDARLKKPAVSLQPKHDLETMKTNAARAS